MATSSKDGALMGYVSVGKSMNPTVGIELGCVLDFWVPEEFRNKGIGSKLLDHALEYIKKEGYSHASIIVSATNSKAIQMYEKRGFKPDRIHLTKRIQRSDNG